MNKDRRNKLIAKGEHYSHAFYLSLVAIEGHGLYAKAALVALMFVVSHLFITRK
jgi:hypothetical protein